MNSRNLFGISQLKDNTSFLPSEYYATTLLCYHMGQSYTTHMALEWYAIKMGISRLEIDWRVIFESISTKYSKWFHYTIIVIGYNHLLKMAKNGVSSNSHKR